MSSGEYRMRFFDSKNSLYLDARHAYETRVSD